MLGLLRVFAIGAMLMAMLTGALSFPNVLRTLTSDRSEPEDRSEPWRPLGSEKARYAMQITLGDRLGFASEQAYPSAFLFCSGATLFVLIRIARTQEEDGLVSDARIAQARGVPLAARVQEEEGR